jgi:dethiobiotin synthetase
MNNLDLLQNLPPRLFITATDTDVGKTWVSALCCASQLKRGLSTAYFKPVQTGVTSFEDSDAGEVLKNIQAWGLGASPAFHAECGAMFAEPATPQVADTQGTLKLAPLLERYHDLAQAYPSMIVEGAGGLLVPVTPEAFVVDWIQAFELPVLLVTRPNLGTLNHTLLSVEALRRRDIPVYGVVINYAKPINDDEANSLAVLTNAALLHQWLPEGVPLLGTIPYAR